MYRYPYFPRSACADKWLLPLAEKGKGIEIGGSAHNDFFIPGCLNVDYTDDMSTIFKQEEVRLCGRAKPVDIVNFADSLSFDDSDVSFIINSHVFEHQVNPIKTLLEWHRVIHNEGIIFSIIPKRDALKSDAGLPITSLYHQIFDWYQNQTYETHVISEGNAKYGHYHIYSVESYIELIDFFNDMNPSDRLEIVEIMETDDKVGNGSIFVHRVIK
jgi:ubiquinone/menaquinone biosynthesis C-methylase UbiE